MVGKRGLDQFFEEEARFPSLGGCVGGSPWPELLRSADGEVCGPRVGPSGQPGPFCGAVVTVWRSVLCPVDCAESLLEQGCLRTHSRPELRSAVCGSRSCWLASSAWQGRGDRVSLSLPLPPVSLSPKYSCQPVRVRRGGGQASRDRASWQPTLAGQSKDQLQQCCAGVAEALGGHY